MENIVIRVDDKKKADFLLQLVKKLGFETLLISDKERRMLARKKLIQIDDNFEKNMVSEDEIQYEVEKVRKKRNAKRK